MNLSIVFTLLFVLFTASPKEKPAANKAPAQTAPATSGKRTYLEYCAVCHGTEGKGNGPAADALKTPPPDLTVLSKNNGGKYPALKVSSAVRGDARVAAHGSKEMPVWGKLFHSMSGGHQSEVDQRVANLVSYIKSLQSQ